MNAGSQIGRQRANLEGRRFRRRRGVSPVEFVLSLPVLLFVMALIIDFGTLASWKARAAVSARQSVWRQRYDRTGASDPQIPGWPGQLGVGGGAQLFNDPFAQFPVVRGPVLAPQSANTSLTVDPNLLDIAGGVQTGTSSIRVRLPLLPGLPRVSFNPQAPLLSSRWQFGNIGLPNNVWRRIPLLYPQLRPDTFFARVPQERAAYIEAAMAIFSAPFRPQLDPLDRDQELHQYRLERFGQDYGYDFHPLISSCYRPPPGQTPGPASPGCTACLLDPNAVYQEYVNTPGRNQGLLQKIYGASPNRGGRGGVPEQMAQTFIQMYRWQISQLQLVVPPDQAAIAAIQAKIDQLNTFIGTLN